jgi:hypothetical protein
VGDRDHCGVGSRGRFHGSYPDGSAALRH